MPLHHWLRKTTAWIALLAVCFGALAPAVSQAALQGQAGNAGQWVQICSTSGITWVRTDAADPAGEHTADTTITCPWGVITGGAADLPPAIVLSLPDAAPQPTPIAQAQRDHEVAPSAHAPARAPPAGV